jgi:hypothetical protein
MERINRIVQIPSLVYLRAMLSFHGGPCFPDHDLFLLLKLLGIVAEDFILYCSK